MSDEMPSALRERSKKVTVTVECVGCKARREIDPGEIPSSEMPYCEKDYLPMIVVSATMRRKR